MAKTLPHSFAALTCEILFLRLQHEIHIVSPLCNILYICTRLTQNITKLSEVSLCDSHSPRKLEMLFLIFAVGEYARGSMGVTG